MCRALLRCSKVHELQALRQQLEPEVDIPQLQPLRDEVERLDQLLAALHQLQVRVCALICGSPLLFILLWGRGGRRVGSQELGAGC